MMKLTDKLIIRNYTNLTDIEILEYISVIIKKGKISKVNGKEQYCYSTIYYRSNNDMVISSTRRNDTYTFYVYYAKRGYKNGIK